MSNIQNVRDGRALLVRAAVTPDPNLWLRRVIWLYLLLLIFEGSLRKWVLPQFSGPLLVIRDPVVLLIYLLAATRANMPWRGLLFALFPLAAITVLVNLIAGQAPLGVILFGFRANFLHLPLVFVMGHVLRKEDVLKVGKMFLFLTPIVAILMMLQFSAAPDAFINRGTGGEGIGQIGSAFGKIRPAGLFSYNTGAGQFLAVATAFALFSVMTKQSPQWLLYPAAASIVLALAVSGSRTSVSGVIIVLCALIPIWTVQPRYWSRFGAIAVATAAITFLMSRSEIFHLGIEVMEARVEGAAGAEGGLAGFLQRAADGFGLSAVSSAPLLGAGLGVGTNVGSQMLSGEMRFLLAEGEWSRVILESGPILGLAYLVWRVTATGHLLRTSLTALRRGEILPVLLLAATAFLLLNGQFGQATTAGFAIVGAGLCLAATNVEIPQETSSDRATLNPEALARGRSVFAERLHQSS